MSMSAAIGRAPCWECDETVSVMSGFRFPPHGPQHACPGRYTDPEEVMSSMMLAADDLWWTELFPFVPSPAARKMRHPDG